MWKPLLLIIILSLATGCASRHAIVSTPPATSIIFPEAVAFGEPDARIIIPKGEYFPHREDETGFYYRAQVDVIVRDERVKFLPGSRHEGGIYWPKTEETPSHVYLKTF